MVYSKGMKDLTLKQKRVLKFIWEKIKSENIPPTIREIGSHFNFSSTGTVRDYLSSLAEKGYIRLKQGQARAIELVNERIFQIPIIGKVRAGPPELAFEDIDGYVNLDNFLFNQEVFALRVKGDSLKDIGVLEGDLALVQKQNTAMGGDIVVAMINEEATIKILKIEGSRIALCPANDKYSELEANEDTKIIGKVLTVVRKYV